MDTPEQFLKLLQEAARNAIKREQFFDNLKAEKGEHHAIVARLTFKLVSVVGMLATIQAAIDSDQFDQGERKQAFHLVIGNLSDAYMELAKNMGLTKGEASELSKAAMAFTDQVMFGANSHAS